MYFKHNRRKIFEKRLLLNSFVFKKTKNKNSKSLKILGTRKTEQNYLKEIPAKYCSNCLNIFLNQGIKPLIEFIIVGAKGCKYG